MMLKIYFCTFLVKSVGDLFQSTTKIDFIIKVYYWFLLYKSEL